MQIQPFTLTRTFHAPRARLWRAWTVNEELKQWFGPKGMPITQCKMDLRPQGLFHYAMRLPTGGEMWGKWTFTDIREPEELRFTVSFSDAEGGTTRHPMAPTWPLEMASTMRFVEAGGQTAFTMEAVPVNPDEAEAATFNMGHESLRLGWGGTLDQLDDYLKRAP